MWSAFVQNGEERRVNKRRVGQEGELVDNQVKEGPEWENTWIVGGDMLCFNK